MMDSRNGIIEETEATEKTELTSGGMSTSGDDSLGYVGQKVRQEACMFVWMGMVCLNIILLVFDLLYVLHE
jgi:hypothetical protein